MPPIPPERERFGRPEAPLLIDAEIAMNAVAMIDDAIRCALDARNSADQAALNHAIRTAARARRSLADGFAHYSRRYGSRGSRRAA